MKKEELIQFLEERGITNVKEIIYNPSYELLFKEETSSSLEVLCNKCMLSKIGSIKEVHTYYKQCKELDSFIDNGL